MSYSFRQERGKNVSRSTSPVPYNNPDGTLKVLKRDGSLQPFDKNKLVNSISKAGATNQQALLVADRVVGRLGGFKQTVPSNQLTSMVARSLSKVNPTASSQYTSFRDQKLRLQPGSTAKGVAFPVGAVASKSVVLTQATPQKIAQTAAVSATKKPSQWVAQPSAKIATAAVPIKPTIEQGPKPDLVVTNVETKNAYRPGCSITIADSVLVNAEFMNNGDEAAFVSDIAFAEAKVFDSQGRCCDHKYMETPKEFFTSGARTPFVIPPGAKGKTWALMYRITVPGVYSLQVMVDWRNEVAELNKTNNVQTLTFTVVSTEQLPDLTPVGMEIENPTESWGAHTINLYVKNVGKAPTHAGNDTAFLDVLINNATFADSLWWGPKDSWTCFPAGDTRIYSRTKRLNPGTEEWIVQINPYKNIVELSYDNNTVKFRVVIGENSEVVSVTPILPHLAEGAPYEGQDVRGTS